MPEIILLSNETIDKIAAGEVVEKPLNVVKELVENAIDAGSTSISVEIKNGGTDLIRVTDNGCGIDSRQCKNAFLRHATSKLRTINDLDSLSSLGFRGEALSSISAVSKTEMITKPHGELLGSRIAVEGGVFIEQGEVGAPDGTTIVIRQLFYNTPARRKFLKSPQSEGAAIEDLMEKFALSHPEIAFQFILNGKNKISTAGNNNAKDVVYHLFGKDIYKSLLTVDYEENGVKITGFTAKPELAYPARNGEIYFINGRYVKSKIVQIAIEEVYRKYLMQHEFPFCVLYINLSQDTVDVNVHPQKMEVRFSDNRLVSQSVIESLNAAFNGRDLIPEVTLSGDKISNVSLGEAVPEASDNRTVSVTTETFDDETDEKTTIGISDSGPRNISFDLFNDEETGEGGNNADDNAAIKSNFIISPEDKIRIPEPFETKRSNSFSFEQAPSYEQLSVFEEKLISDEPIKRYRIIGQVFETYWLITLDDDLYIVDQHAAHEKVNYENFVKLFNETEVKPGQLMAPPMVIHLSPKEEQCLLSYMDVFVKIGYEFQEFGQASYAVRSVPYNLYGSTREEMFHRILDELMEKEGVYSPSVVLEKIASMSCKAAIKGNQRISFAEMEHLMTELMSLENPYNCPHGRPVFIRITKTELEKKFRRIV